MARYDVASLIRFAKAAWRFAQWLLFIACVLTAWWLWATWGVVPAVLWVSHVSAFLLGAFVMQDHRRRLAEENNHWLSEEIEPVKHAAHLADVALHRRLVSGETPAVTLYDQDGEPTWVEQDDIPHSHLSDEEWRGFADFLDIPREGAP